MDTICSLDTCDHRQRGRVNAEVKKGESEKDICSLGRKRAEQRVSFVSY